MQILAIRGNNLASLAGNFEVEFDTGPLADAGIFAITGPTGAGKSTLLDAISLALFDTIPRLESAPRTGQITKDEIGPQDTRAILRHGAGHGFAEVDFLGRDGQPYRSRWTVRRARERADGKLQASTIDLECLQTGRRMGGKKKETLSEILRLVGLNAQQFGRAVVLAQGEFEAFIKADGDERAQLLEKLTGADIYTRLGKLAFEKARDVRNGYDSLEKQIAALNGLSTEARTALEDERKAAQATHDMEVAAYTRLLDIQTWHHRLADLTKKHDDAVRTCEAARQACEEAAPRRVAFQRYKQIMEHFPDWRTLTETEEKVRQSEAAFLLAGQAEKSAMEVLSLAEQNLETAQKSQKAAREAQQNAEPELEAARKLDIALSHAETVLNSAKDILSPRQKSQDEARNALANIKQNLIASEVERNDLKVWLEIRHSLAGLVPHEDELITALKIHAQSRNSLESCVTQEQKASIQHDEATAEFQKAGKTRDNLGHLLSEAEAATIKAEAEAPDPVETQQLSTDIQALEAIERKNIEARRVQKDFNHASTILEKTVEDIVRLTDEQARQMHEAQTISTQLPILVATAQEAKRAEEHLRNTTSDAAALMRAALVEGEACPVCGATEHHLHALDALFGTAVEKAQTQRVEAETALETVRHRQIELKTRISAVQSQLSFLADQKNDHIQTRDASQAGCIQAEAELTDACRKLALEVNSSGDLMNECVRRREALHKKQSALQEKVCAVENIRKAERVARANWDAARQSYDLANDRCLEAERTLREAHRIRAEKDAERHRLETLLDNRLSGIVDWRILQDDATVWLSTTLAEWKVKNEALAQLDENRPGLLIREAEAKKESQNAEKVLVAAQEECAAKQGQYQHYLKQRVALLDGKSVEYVIEELSAALRATEQAVSAAQKAESEARENCVGAKTRCEGAAILFEETRKDLVRLSDTLDTQLTLKGFNRDDICNAQGLGPDHALSEERTLSALDKVFHDACATLKPRESDLVHHKATYQKDHDVEDLEGRLGQAKVSVQKAREAVLLLEAKILQDDDSLLRTASLRNRLEEMRASGHVWEQLSDMIGDAQGKKFRNFAQSVTLDHLLDFANERLADLKPRYTLQRASGGEMLIEVVDNDMGGLVRGLQNLSGGERFLVSLALALGLSEMSTGQGIRIESLFIDEGFGALDSASLGQAIAVLEHLQAQGRRVGVISHVEELKERIPVKIEVTPVSGGRSQIAIVVD